MKYYSFPFQLTLLEILLKHSENTWTCTGLNGSLTGDNATLEDIWNTFGVVVQEMLLIRMLRQEKENIITTKHEDMGFDEPKLYFGIENNSMQELDYSPNGWTMFNLVAEDANWTFNYSTSQYGNMVSEINGYESPEDWSWWWSLKIWNESSTEWEDSPVGIDGVDASENNQSHGWHQMLIRHCSKNLMKKVFKSK